MFFGFFFCVFGAVIVLLVGGLCLWKRGVSSLRRIKSFDNSSIFSLFFLYFPLVSFCFSFQTCFPLSLSFRSPSFSSFSRSFFFFFFSFGDSSEVCSKPFQKE